MGAAPHLWVSSYLGLEDTCNGNFSCAGSVAEVLPRLRESYVVELSCRIYDISNRHRTNLIRLHSLSLSVNIVTALLLFPDWRLQDQANLFSEFEVAH